MSIQSGEKIILRAARQQDAQRVGDIAVAAWQRVFESWRKLVGEEIFCLYTDQLKGLERIAEGKTH